MEFSEVDQSYTEFDWFCTDKSGYVGHFATAGYKSIPKSVASSAEDLAILKNFFEGLRGKSGQHILDSQLAPEQRTERVTQSFVEMADRGLFSFDIGPHLRPGICYFRVALPLTPLRVDDLPDHIRDLLSRTVLENRLLVDSPQIPYEETTKI